MLRGSPTDGHKPPKTLLGGPLCCSFHLVKAVPRSTAPLSARQSPTTSLRRRRRWRRTAELPGRSRSRLIQPRALPPTVGFRMESWGFSDGNISDHVERRRLGSLPEINYRMQLHSSLVQRLSLEKELEGHEGCVNAVSWNSTGTLLISGSDDTRINLWGYNSGRLIHSIDTGHTANIFCTKFVPETSDEIVVSGAGDAEVRLFHLSHFSMRRHEENAPNPMANFQCHSRRVKKLAVECGNPNVIWSASEDGTLRQHDLREGISCPPAGSSNQECRNVLLDLRCASKKSLSDYPKQCLALKSCDISTTRPHQLIVGGSDAFARLYDRRMLPPLSSSQTKLKPPPCVSYFCPMHLSDHKRSSLHLTHVAFSPSGEELLLSYSGEHAYLMDTNYGDQGIVKYSPGDALKLVGAASPFNEMEVCSLPVNSINRASTSKFFFKKLDMYNKLVQAAIEILKCGSNYAHGIEACCEVLDGKGPEVSQAVKLECLCTRAALFLKRGWKNDAYMALRDCLNAKKVDASSYKPYYFMSEALLQLGKLREAQSYAAIAETLAPTVSEDAIKVDSLKNRILAAEADKNRKDADGTSKDESQTRSLRSLSDLLFRSEVNSDMSQDGPRPEREDSEYDEEMESDFETSISGDEAMGNADASIVRGSLNLRLLRGEGNRDDDNVNGSCGSPSSSTEKLTRKIEYAVDMKQRYVGHCNIGTDIKQASFLGQNGEYVASGSDDGRWFIWEKRTGRLIKVLSGDEAVVNCVQCHPLDCVVATSGIDSTIKLWSPRAESPSIVAGGVAGPETAEVLSIIEGNQHKLCNNHETVLPMGFLERFRMQEFEEGTVVHPFECIQS